MPDLTLTLALTLTLTPTLTLTLTLALALTLTLTLHPNQAFRDRVVARWIALCKAEALPCSEKFSLTATLGDAVKIRAQPLALTPTPNPSPSPNPNPRDPP